MSTSEEAEQAAAAIAEEWFPPIDAGDYAESWNQASSLFKEGVHTSSLFRAGVTAQQWQSSLAALRRDLGRVVSRTLRSAQYTEELPGDPDGEFVTLEYGTTFEGKSVGESVVVVKESDGHWRVSEYRVRLGESKRGLAADFQSE